MDVRLQPVFTVPIQQAGDSSMINPEFIFCGACSWQGPPGDLTESLM
jgi:hypothetical protein